MSRVGVSVFKGARMLNYEVVNSHKQKLTVTANRVVPMEL